jgi:alpha-glucosidase
MLKLFGVALTLGLLTLRTVCGGDDVFSPGPVGVASPDGRVRVDLDLTKSAKAGSVPKIRVTFRGRPVLRPSLLQVNLADGTRLGADCIIESSATAAINVEYRQHPGKRSRVADRGREVVIRLRERGEPSRTWQIIARAYDDGVAFRYRFPAQEGWSSLVLAGEGTVFTLPEDARAWALPLNSFTTSHEKLYEYTPVAKLPGDWLLGLPLLLDLPETGWAAITEAKLTDYAGMYLARAPGKEPALVSRLSPLPGDPKVAVRGALPHESPWRVVLIAEQPGHLIESDLLLNVNDPCAVADVSWIQPGKTTFPWWNGYYEEKVPFQPGLNTATVKYYIDFCAEAGIPYHSLDGKGNTAWYGGPIVPYNGADPTTAVEGLDLPEVLRYAKTKNVRIRLWMHWEAAKAHMSRAFPRYHAWGVEGVMIDFMDRDDQEMVNFQRELLKTAAANRLTVTFHGVAKPTGLERTYPNLLTSEGVLNLEYDKWDKVGVLPEHELTVPFTRMLAGPLDFHQGSFRTVSLAEFKPRNEAPLIVGTPCRTLASYVIFQNHLSMVADYPSAYRGHPALPVLVKIPTTWDDTKVLAGVVGEFLVIARRHGEEWWVGTMTNRDERDLAIPLSFLETGWFQAEVFSDALNSEYRLARMTKNVEARDKLTVKLAAAGGSLIRLTPRKTVEAVPGDGRHPRLIEARSTPVEATLTAPVWRE